MSFYKLKENDIINLVFETRPVVSTQLNGNQITGSVYLEKKYLNSNLENRIVKGFSEKRGGGVTGSYPFSASIDIKTAQSGATNNNLWSSVYGGLYPFYRLRYDEYQTAATSFRIIDIPSIYYDRGIQSGSFTASDNDSAGDSRILYDNGLGGIYSGSVTGSLVGHIFYGEGIVCLTASNLSDFGAPSTNFKWKVDFRAIHKIPVKIFKCRAPAGQLNASTNPTYYQTPDDGDFAGEREVVVKEKAPYITTIGLFNKHYELVGLAKLAQPVKKNFGESTLYRVRIDF